MTSRSDLSYKAAGVDIAAGEALVERIKAPIRRTQRPEVLGGLGGFGGLFRVPEGYTSPVLVAGTDGVGTKLKLAIEHDAHEGIGTDLVAMCVNDIVVLGAEPLFFLDYFVTPELDVDVAERVITGIAEGCRDAGAALIGGETAEHPGMHAHGEYDLAGFAVGIVEHERIIDGRRIEAGDSVIGLASSGPHSNGFSLIRRVLEQPSAPAGAPPPMGELLEPTRIYVRPVLALIRDADVKGLAHITGGGLTQNIPRVLPAGLGAELDAASWPRGRVFDWLENAGVAPDEMHRTFNCGIGMVAILAPAEADRAIASLEAAGERAYRIGHVVTDTQSRVVIR